MTLQPGVIGLALGQHIAENNVREIAVIAERDRVQAPVCGKIKVDMTILPRIGFNGHTTRRQTDFQLLAQNVDQLFKLGFQVLGAFIFGGLAVFVSLAARDVPLHFQHNLTGQSAANLRCKVQGFHIRAILALAPRSHIAIQVIPVIQCLRHLGRKRRFDAGSLFDALVWDHAVNHLPYHL